MTCLPTWRCGVDVRLTLRLKEGERLEWEAAAGADVPLSRFVKRVVNEHVRASRTPAHIAKALDQVAPLEKEDFRDVSQPRREPTEVAPEIRQVADKITDAKTAFKADPKQVQQIRDLARDLAGTSGKCSADAPRGTVCKVCGKKH